MKTLITMTLTFLVLSLSTSTINLNAQCTSVTDYTTLQGCFINSVPNITIVATINLTGNIQLVSGVTYNIYFNTGTDIIRNGNFYVDINNNAQIVYIGTPNVVINNHGSSNTLVGLNGVNTFITFINGAVLSIELNDFKISKKSTTNVLSWTTTSNKNIDKFIIEKSRNGKEFIQIGSVKADINDLNDYSFSDNTPLSINYYRLHILEKDGQSSYSKVLTAMSNGSSKDLKVYPNPIAAGSYLNIETTKDIQNVVITNTFGQVVLTSNVSKIDVAHLAKGFYNIAVKTNDETMVEKFLKQ